MKEDSKIIAVLTEKGDLNIHIVDAERMESVMKEEMSDEYEAMEAVLSTIYDLCAIQWQEIKKISIRKG